MAGLMPMMVRMRRGTKEGNKGNGEVQSDNNTCRQREGFSCVIGWEHGQGVNSQVL